MPLCSEAGDELKNQNKSACHFSNLLPLYNTIGINGDDGERGFTQI
jgi:hypothetical protein